MYSNDISDSLNDGKVFKLACKKDKGINLGYSTILRKRTINICDSKWAHPSRVVTLSVIRIAGIKDDSIEVENIDI